MTAPVRRHGVPQSAIHGDKRGMLGVLDALIAEHTARRKSHSEQAEDQHLREYQRAAHRSLRSYESGVSDGLALARQQVARWADADRIGRAT